MKVLVACEESQTVCKAFRELGHEAYSCDIQECSGGHPEWHVVEDALQMLSKNITIVTMDGETHFIDGWDLIIAHPPCTYLSSVTTRHLSLKCTPAEKVIDRMWKLAESAVFFMQFALADCDKVCVENPLGFISRLWRKPDQTIHPYYFAESPNDKENYHKKRTCLWLKGLQPLKYNIDFVAPEPIGYSPSGKAYNFEEMATGQNRAKTRSKTFPGIARAMAEQWGQKNPVQPEPYGEEIKK